MSSDEEEEGEEEIVGGKHVRMLQSITGLPAEAFKGLNFYLFFWVLDDKVVAFDTYLIVLTFLLVKV